MLGDNNEINYYINKAIKNMPEYLPPQDKSLKKLKKENKNFEIR